MIQAALHQGRLSPSHLRPGPNGNKWTWKQRAQSTGKPSSLRTQTQLKWLHSKTAPYYPYYHIVYYGVVSLGDFYIFWFIYLPSLPLKYAFWISAISWHFSTFLIVAMMWTTAGSIPFSKRQGKGGRATQSFPIHQMFSSFSPPQSWSPILLPVLVAVAKDWFTLFDCLRNKLMRLLETPNICIFTMLLRFYTHGRCRGFGGSRLWARCSYDNTIYDFQNHNVAVRCRRVMSRRKKSV